jgi:hypothetical protein
MGEYKWLLSADLSLPDFEGRRNYFFDLFNKLK